MNIECTFKRDLEAYLADIENSKVRSLEDLIQFNKDNAEIELPPGESFVEERL